MTPMISSRREIPENHRSRIRGALIISRCTGVRVPGGRHSAICARLAVYGLHPPIIRTEKYEPFSESSVTNAEDLRQSSLCVRRGTPVQVEIRYEVRIRMLLAPADSTPLFHDIIFLPTAVVKDFHDPQPILDYDEVAAVNCTIGDSSEDDEDWEDVSSTEGTADEGTDVPRYRYVPEQSPGGAPTSIIQVADPEFSPVAWIIHPNISGNMLCAPDLFAPRPNFSGGDYACVLLDLDFAKPAARCTRTFLTAAADGYVRLYDTRRPLPSLSLAAEECGGAVLVRPGGIPQNAVVLAGSSKDEVVRLWDVRAAKTVYELSAGNNAVGGLAWDAECSVLYVATVSANFNRKFEHTFGYRLANVDGMVITLARRGDRGRNQDALRAMNARCICENDTKACENAAHTLLGDHNLDCDSDPDYDYRYDRWDEDISWPCNALHKEDYFGALFDAGEHRLFRYAFREQADPSVLPVYGTAPAE
ncbi:hypothetical protein FB451DRAFT_1556344 [Mycena latifolia]|nr:hypothetical protein FB451DRAFT_1556344 [Mycena latifolia]